jgi:hypothetical protein
MASTLKLEFQDDTQYQFCVNKFAAYYGFDGTRRQKVDFLQAKVISFIYDAVEAEVIAKKRDSAVTDGKTETATNLDVTKIVPSEQQ